MGTALSGVTPTLVIPLEPEFYTIISQSEGMKKQYQSISGTTAVFKYRLVWKNMSNANFWTLHNHYYSCQGGYDSFVWKCVPLYIDTDHDGTVDGSDLTGRWVENTFQFSPNAKTWDAEIVFEKSV